eukprot:NODE_226_length_13883_cov_0.528729.p13 type:complete len:106 gc:universal NODE_226_length_13883_cov_0.528729:3113-3430(+)
MYFSLMQRLYMQNNEIKKNDLAILLPKELKFLEYPLAYSLKGIFNHSGGSRGGHYWLEVYSNDQWLKCNDSLVETSDFDIDLPASSATCLVYAIDGVFKSYKSEK